MEDDRDTVSFTTRTEASYLASDFTKFYFETGKNTGPSERFLTGWKIRRRSTPYTIARISLQMSFPSFCSILAHTARCKYVRKRVEIYGHPEGPQPSVDKI